MSARRDPHADSIPVDQRPACWPDKTPTQIAQDEWDAEVDALAKLHARTVRADGWTPDRQRLFLLAIADGHSVTASCAQVGLSVASVYAFRQRASGAGFAVGWDAARLLAREVIADTLAARALEGQVERTTRPDGTVVERFRYDNRLASTMLARLDRQVAANDEPTGLAARLIASEFQAYLAQLGEGGPSRAALFLARRMAGQGPEALRPLVAMAHADSFVRANGAVPDEVDTSDLDVTDRAHWTAGQWARAEAAGLLCLAGLHATTARDSQLPQRAPANDADHDPDDPPVWFEESEDGAYDEGEWHTRFPPPPDFDGEEISSPGAPEYWRTLSDEEQAIVDAAEDAAGGDALTQAIAARDRWFAALAGEVKDDVSLSTADGDDQGPS